ncbi:MAG TPA: type II secretion system inner membrane protein GspF [Myxococcales bacterium LLY-WYZ-16_1]|nr:type II secretion system inner membrane protein GspF [Myxococcales bacterium LLY-WYZ-16_1]
MPVYAYKGLNTSGREVKGMLDAESPKMLRSQLRRSGIRIIEHREESATPESTSAGAGLQTQIDLKKYLDRKPSVGELALVTRQLSTLLRSGITLIDALTAIGDQVESEKMKRVFGSVKADVNEGLSLADSMQKHDEIFNHLYVSMVRAGEASGALDKVLARLADFTEAQARLRSKIQSAMLYPLIMLGVGSLIMLILFIVVIPRITKIFEQVKAELPLQTKLLIFIADTLKNYYFILFPLLGVLVWVFLRWKKSPKGKPRWDRFTLVAPVFGPVVRLVAISRFSRTLATLLRSGVPVLNALDITKDVLDNERLSSVVGEAREAIREGESIATPLKRSGEFPPIVVHMVSTGEKSGQLEEMLEHVADNYDFQVDQRVEKLTTLIEPIMIVGMGVAVAFIVFSVLLPILQISQHVR